MPVTSNMQHEDSVTDRQQQSFNAGADEAAQPPQPATNPVAQPATRALAETDGSQAQMNAPYPGQHPDQYPDQYAEQSTDNAWPEADVGTLAVPGSEMPDLGHLSLEGVTEGTLSDYTMQELQLRSQPFTGASAEGELFADEVTYSQLNEVRQAIIRGDTVLLLSGETGAGKTTLLKQLTRNSGQRLQFFSVKGGEKYTTHNLLNGILDAWKLSTPSDYEGSAKEMLLALQASLERNMIVVLLLDDADLIPDKELQLLLATIQYFNNDELLLRIILSAKPQFEQRLPELLPKGSNLPYAVMQVEPLLASRAAPYLQLRLNQAGHFDEFPLSEKQVSTIANDSSGYPGRINFLAAQALNHLYSPFGDTTAAQNQSPGFFASLKNKTGGKNLRKGIFALLGIGLIAAGIFWTSNPERADNTGPQQAGTSGTSESSNTTDAQYSTVETRPVNAETTGNGSTNTNEQATSPAIDNSGETLALANSDGATDKTDAANETAATVTGDNTATTVEDAATENAELQAAANELSEALGTSTGESAPSESSAGSEQISSNAENPPAESTTDSGNTSAADNSTQVVESPVDANEAAAEETSNPVPASTDDAAASATATPERETSSNTSTAGDAANTQAASPGADEAADTDAELPATNSEAETGASGSETANAEAGQPPASSAGANASGDAVGSLESPNWVLLQNPDLWTIQLSASPDKNDIVRFQDKANLESPTSIYSFKREETTWYALVQGLYKTLPDARKAIESMSDAAIKNQPWIRKIGSIQNNLK